MKEKNFPPCGVLYGTLCHIIVSKNKSQSVLGIQVEILDFFKVSLFWVRRIFLSQKLQILSKKIFALEFLQIEQL